MYEVPNINWKGLVEYIEPLITSLGDLKSLNENESSAEVIFECCRLLFHYDAQDRYISTHILDLDVSIDAKHLIQINPSFDYYLNGDFKNYLKTLNKRNFEYLYTLDNSLVFDYILAILNSKGLANFVRNGFDIDDYVKWSKINFPMVNEELIRIYKANCIL